MTFVKDAVLNAATKWGRGGFVSDVNFVDDEHGLHRLPIEGLPPLRDDAFRVVCISDTHDSHRSFAIPKADILIHAGDLQLSSRIFSASDCSRKIKDFNDWLGSLDVTHKVVVGGNHDAYLESLGPKGAKSALFNANYLVFEDLMLTHPRNDNLNLFVYGAPFSLGSSSNSAYQLRSDPVARQSCAIPTSMIPMVEKAIKLGSSDPLYDLMVTHQPYYLTVKSEGSGPEKKFLSSNVHVGGHLHNHYGVRRRSSGQVSIVACSVSHKYTPHNPPIVFDIAPLRTIASLPCS